ncbi:hypothetical protein D3C71_1811850 [compost metagenome]
MLIRIYNFVTAAINSNAKAVLIEAPGSIDQSEESSMKALNVIIHLSMLLMLNLNLDDVSAITINVIAKVVQIGFM